MAGLSRGGPSLTKARPPLAPAPRTRGCKRTQDDSNPPGICRPNNPGPANKLRAVGDVVHVVSLYLYLCSVIIGLSLYITVKGINAVC
ncbi:hypothetical protein EYF80_066462 [Liparis tanakae]|uniref:Uncharacterized protein n=1 Tax=Liparis tanakae TaxID=230148 RepID=A0A4Z2E3S0_9TELE|nr:hypothetical protein EYF80_066462 [Liparis tanakae]